MTLLQSAMPTDNHGLVVSGNNANTTTASSTAQLAKGVTGGFQSPNSALLYASGTPNQTLALRSLTPTGGSQPHNNLMPYLTLNSCIALVGVFPPRP